LPPLSIPHDAISTFVQAPFEEVVPLSRKLSGGLLVTFLSSIGFELSGNRDKVTKRTVSAKRVETKSFTSTEELLNASLVLPAVEVHLGALGLRHKRLFIVTGVKIASGASISESEGQTYGASLMVGFDGSGMGISISVGPKVEGSKERSREVTWECEESFVFAYRLREIRFRNGVVRTEQYRDGAVYGIGEAEVRKEAEDEAVIVFLDLDKDDMTGEDVGIESLEIREEEKEADVCEMVKRSPLQEKVHIVTITKVFSLESTHSPTYVIL
jgi:hypothetical protein